MRRALMEKVEQVVRLIRSKGVGVYFVTQNPLDVPETILGQLGNRVQHALRAFTPRDQKAVKAAAQTMWQNPALKTEQVISELSVGEALVSFLDEGARRRWSARLVASARLAYRSAHTRGTRGGAAGLGASRSLRAGARSRVCLRKTEGGAASVERGTGKRTRCPGAGDRRIANARRQRRGIAERPDFWLDRAPGGSQRRHARIRIAQRRALDRLRPGASDPARHARRNTRRAEVGTYSRRSCHSRRFRRSGV